MEYIYTFVGGSPDFRWLSKGQFRLQFGLKQALGYLEQIRGTLSGEAKDRRQPGCFYTGLRHAFAEIDGLGKLYKGEYGKDNTAANAIAFGVDYLGRINPRYKDVFGLLFDMYRHGLAHGHLIRTARYQKGSKWHFVYWEITEDPTNHLAFRNKGKRTWLVVSVPQLVDDTIAAIDKYIEDLKERGSTSRLLSRLRRGYEGTCTALREPPLAIKPPATRKPKPKPGKLQLNPYSRNGIDWIRRKA